MGLGYKILGGSLLIVGGIIGITYFSKQSEKEKLKKIDQWCDEMTAKALEEKINAPVNTILEAFNGVNNIDLLNKVQNIVDSVSLIFTKESPLLISMLLKINYKDETSYSASIQKNWDNLPGLIREEFLRKGTKVISFPWKWNMPYKNSKI